MAVLSRLFPSLPVPAAPTAYSGPFLCGTAAKMLGPRIQWLQGYYWGVCNTAQSVAPQKFATWTNTSGGNGVLIPGSVVTSGPLTRGQWNLVMLPAPIPLALGTPFVVCTGWSTVGTTGFPDTQNQFGTGGPYVNGLTSGNLFAYSDGTGGGLPAAANPTAMAQGVFSAVLGTDPAAHMPNQGSNSSLFYMDLLTSDTPPFGYTGPFSLYPGNAVGNTSVTLDLNVPYNVGTEFWLSAPMLIYSVRYLSPGGAASLATRAALWSVTAGGLGGAELAAIAAPAWSGAAGTGWVQADFAAPVLLPAGRYRVAVYNANGALGGWNAKDSITGAFGTGDFAGGIINGPLSAPGQAAASLCFDYSSADPAANPPYSTGTTEPGQCPFGQLPSGAAGTPYLYAGPSQNYFVDVVAYTAPAAGAGGDNGGIGIRPGRLFPGQGRRRPLVPGPRGEYAHAA